jgi:hypothetical protein
VNGLGFKNPIFCFLFDDVVNDGGGLSCCILCVQYEGAPTERDRGI